MSGIWRMRKNIKKIIIPLEETVDHIKPLD